jgi:competence protein ComEA
MVIYVPRNGEENEATEALANAVQSSSTTAQDQSGTGGTVNINVATAEELQTLPGIGPSKAETIIAYREENGGFDSIEDLMNVSGIGEKSFGKLKASITVK